LKPRNFPPLGTPLSVETICVIYYSTNFAYNRLYGSKLNHTYVLYTYLPTHYLIYYRKLYFGVLISRVNFI